MASRSITSASRCSNKKPVSCRNTSSRWRDPRGHTELRSFGGSLAAVELALTQSDSAGAVACPALGRLLSRRHRIPLPCPDRRAGHGSPQSVVSQKATNGRASHAVARRRAMSSCFSDSSRSFGSDAQQARPIRNRAHASSPFASCATAISIACLPSVESCFNLAPYQGHLSKPYQQSRLVRYICICSASLTAARASWSPCSARPARA